MKPETRFLLAFSKAVAKRKCSCCPHASAWWSERLGLRASKTKEDFLEDWQMDDCSVQFTLDNNKFQVDYIDVEEELSILYINLIPDDLFADI